MAGKWVRYRGFKLKLVILNNIGLNIYGKTEQEMKTCD